MPNAQRKKFAQNTTRQAPLASDVSVAATHWSRLIGLLATPAADFEDRGLWIKPCHGVHTLGMRYPIDVIYLDENLRVIHLERLLRPWRLGAIRRRATTVLELPAGTIDRTLTEIGDQITITLEAAWEGALRPA